jgi:hypothetical protein
MAVPVGAINHGIVNTPTKKSMTPTTKSIIIATL